MRSAPQPTTMLVVSMLPRMNPPGFQIGFIGCAMPVVFQQRDIIWLGPHA